MADDRLLAETLGEFARTMARGYAISYVLHDLVQRAVDVAKVDGAGVSLQEGTRLRFVTAVDERITVLERIQECEQIGPCIEAWQTGTAVTIADLGQLGGRWGAYEPAAAEMGIAAVAGIPLRVRSDVVGALDLYRNTPGEWSAAHLRIAGALADMAASYVVNASELERQRRLTEQLQEALDSRIVIEQAKGVLAAERNVSVDDAFELLRGHARRHNSNLRSVAEAVVKLGLRP